MRLKLQTPVGILLQISCLKWAITWSNRKEFAFIRQWDWESSTLCTGWWSTFYMLVDCHSLTKNGSYLGTSVWQSVRIYIKLDRWNIIENNGYKKQTLIGIGWSHDQVGISYQIVPVMECTITIRKEEKKTVIFPSFFLYKYYLIRNCAFTNLGENSYDFIL